MDVYDNNLRPKEKWTTLEIHNTIKRREQGGVVFELNIGRFSLFKGEFVAIVGESGCGKSTLLDLLALVSRPTDCEVFRYRALESESHHDVKLLWDQGDESGLARLRRSELGYVLQTGGLLPFLSVRQNIELATQLNGERRDDDLTRFARQMGIEKVLDKKPQYLSGGQRQRVAILRALHHRPRLILADEPTAAVDKRRAQHIVEDFNRLAQKTDATVVMVTHDRALVAPFAHRTFSFAVEEVTSTFTRSVCYQEDGLADGSMPK
ncbi:MAG: ATP-binding cassette domain-containing protein [Thiocapsa sp.]|uniref:ABC transporter ATP-binding protein n=1 Tax=Thiocapsa sp. TaxID=2024551 RepID=UPI001BCF4764|nr:ATP-binding cassette domain-containing protein [Thiocapsa sp.]QVL50258.1 MAG: ATP-binding cassette domain-containing protein [Thiocapsa sp.]